MIYRDGSQVCICGAPKFIGEDFCHTCRALDRWRKERETKKVGTQTAMEIMLKAKEDLEYWKRNFIPLPKKENRALTFDEGKEPLAQLPWAAINEMSKVQAYGHKKYKDFNNYRKGMEVTRNLSCAIRHIRDYLEGVEVDHESGLNPLAHAMCRLAFVLQNLRDGTAIDDRYKRGYDV